MILSLARLRSGPLTRLFPGVRAMAGIIFAVAIALATILCVGVVIWASDY
jgi:hypothetical protein